ncbi:DUF6368 family protein, partial [Streptomyces chiangmaiensis]
DGTRTSKLGRTKPGWFQPGWCFCNHPVDHVVTALLTAAVMDVVGGVVKVELREGALTPGFGHGVMRLREV